jgi:hypothetical protein
VVIVTEPGNNSHSGDEGQRLSPALIDALERHIWIADSDLSMTRLGSLADALIPVGPNFHPAKPPPRLSLRLRRAEVPNALSSEIETVAHAREPLRVGLWMALRDLVSDWIDLSADHEKLLGHMLLEHDASAMYRRKSFESLARLHGQLHQTA